MTAPRLQSVELADERVRLVPLDVAYAQTAFDLLHESDEILRWLVWDGPESLAEIEQFYSKWIKTSDNGDDYHFAILDRETGEFIGCIGSRFAGHPGTADIGYWLAHSRWGQGYMGAAVRLISHLCFRYLESQVLTAHVFVGNHGSQRVLEKNGYSLIHTATAKVVKRGEPVDEWYFTLMRHQHEERFGAYQPEVDRIELAVGST